MEWFKPLEGFLVNFVTLTKFSLETLSAVCVAIGLIKTLELMLTLKPSRRKNQIFSFNKIRLSFGVWLALALEFQLAADILATTVAPSFEELGRLALIALIRTFLNYFLNKELEVQYQMEKEQGELNQEI